jgi:hypothetical protein
MAGLDRFTVGFAEGLVGRTWRPADHDQKQIENEEGDGEVVENDGLVRVGPYLVGGPEEKSQHEHDCLGPFPPRWPVRSLVDEVGECDGRQRDGCQSVVRFAGKQVREGIAEKNSADDGKSDGAQNDGKSSMGPVETVVHGPLLRGLPKEFARPIAASRIAADRRTQASGSNALEFMKAP